MTEDNALDGCQVNPGTGKVLNAVQPLEGGYNNIGRTNLSMTLQERGHGAPFTICLIRKEQLMKRSEINAILQSADEFIRGHGFLLPPFAYWTPETWKTKGPETAEIVENRLGWDITDFGSKDFDRVGLFLFTIRNGSPENWKKLQGKLYAEKIMIVRTGQITPMHFHWNKSEDIINRGGGDLVIQLYNATLEDGLDVTDVTVSIDGTQHNLPKGAIVRLLPGESITLPPRLYHTFWGEKSWVLVGEVSLVNDDQKDNRFLEPIGRFPDIEEDEPPVHLLSMDYERYYQGSSQP
jgi:D-lyxose ketol-isomerase